LILISLVVLVHSQYLTNVPTQTTTTNEPFCFINGTCLNITKFEGPQGEFSHITFLNLHANENTSIVAARTLVSMKGGRVIYFSSVNSRLISFNMQNRRYTFDPNRMFTRTGIIRNLMLYSNGTEPSEEAVNQVEQFANTVLKVYNFDEVIQVISIHNNGPNYSAREYLPGRPFEKEAEMVFINNETNPHFFFFVNDEAYFNNLKSIGFNVVLQKLNSSMLTDDGSLSV